MDLVVPIAADAWDWGRAGIVLAGGLTVALLARYGAPRLAAARDSDPRGLRVLGRLVSVVVVTIALVYSLAQLGVRLGPLLTAAGVGGVALAFAVRSIFENFLAGVLLLLRRPFRTGDEVCSGGHEGIVEDVNLRAVVLRTYDGERVYIPNGSVLSSPIVNRTAFAARRTELEVGIAYEADAQHACDLLVAAASSVDEVLDHPLPEALVHELGESAVVIALRFWHSPEVRVMWRVRHAVAVAVKETLERESISIPFPQITLRTVDGDLPPAVRVVGDQG